MGVLKCGSKSVLEQSFMSAQITELTVISQESDDKVITQGEQVHRIPEEIRDPVVLSDERHEQELQDVEEEPDR